MKRIPLTQGKVALVDDEDYERIAKWKWCASRRGENHWRARRGRTSGNPIHYMHHMVLCPPKGYEVDHVNRNGLDNRRSNLRLVTRSQNLMNCAKRPKTSSRYKGVAWDKAKKKWIAQINIRLFGNKSHHVFLGRFAKEKDAAYAYDAAAMQFFREFARLNFKQERK